MATPLAHAPLAADSRTRYACRSRRCLAWLAAGSAVDVLGDPLADPSPPDGAVRDFKSWLKAARRKPTTVNNHLAAFDARQTRRYQRTAETCVSTRDRAITLPCYAGLRLTNALTGAR